MKVSKAQLRILRSMRGGNILKDLTPDMRAIMVKSGWIRLNRTLANVSLYCLTKSGYCLAA